MNGWNRLSRPGKGSGSKRYLTGFPPMPGIGGGYIKVKTPFSGSLFTHQNRREHTGAGENYRPRLFRHALDLLLRLLLGQAVLTKLNDIR